MRTKNQKSKDWFEVEVYHEFPLIGTNGQPRFNAIQTEFEKVKGSVKYSVNKNPAADSWLIEVNNPKNSFIPLPFEITD